MITLILSLIGLTVAAFTDYRTRQIPNWLTYGMIASGIILAFAESIFAVSVWPFLIATVTTILAFAAFWGLYKINQIGGGDVKLLVGLNALNPGTITILGTHPQFVFIVFLLMTMLTSAYFLAYRALTGIHKKNLPGAPFILIAFLLLNIAIM